MIFNQVSVYEFIYLLSSHSLLFYNVSQSLNNLFLKAKQQFKEQASYFKASNLLAKLQYKKISKMSGKMRIKQKLFKMLILQLAIFEHQKQCEAEFKYQVLVDVLTSIKMPPNLQKKFDIYDLSVSLKDGQLVINVKCQSDKREFEDTLQKRTIPEEYKTLLSSCEELYDIIKDSQKLSLVFEDNVPMLSIKQMIRKKEIEYKFLLTEMTNLETESNSTASEEYHLPIDSPEKQKAAIDLTLAIKQSQNSRRIQIQHENKINFEKARKTRIQIELQQGERQSATINIELGELRQKSEQIHSQNRQNSRQDVDTMHRFNITGQNINNLQNQLNQESINERSWLQKKISLLSGIFGIGLVVAGAGLAIQAGMAASSAIAASTSALLPVLGCIGGVGILIGGGYLIYRTLKS